VPSRPPVAAATLQSFSRKSTPAGNHTRVIPVVPTESERENTMSTHQTPVHSCVTTREAREASTAGRPWRLRCVYVGFNAENESLHSSKFWQLEGNGDGSVSRRWGKIGAKGSSGSISFYDGVDKLHEKTGKGYRISVR
jgi:predicted DNA-binding WGR domain protein